MAMTNVNLKNWTIATCITRVSPSLQLVITHRSPVSAMWNDSRRIYESGIFQTEQLLIQARNQVAFKQINSMDSDLAI